MKKPLLTSLFCLLGAVALSLTLLGGQAQAGTRAKPKPAAPSKTIRVTVDGKGFHPAQVEIKVKRPTRLVFVRKSDQTCATAVHCPALGIAETRLPLNREVTINLTPAKVGSFPFGCPMDMMVKGTLVVVP